MAARVLDILDLSLDVEAEVRRAAGLLSAGELVVLPTETVYGIAGRLDVPQAADALRRLRGSNPQGPLTPHLPDASAATQYLGHVPEVGRRLMKKLWPGPVALIFDVPPDRRADVCRTLKVSEADLYNDAGRVVLRCPDDEITRQILAATGQPTVLTRAGLPGGTEATRPPLPADVPADVNLIVDAGPTRHTRPSTVVRVGDDLADSGGWDVVRVGTYDRRIVEKLLKTTVVFVCSGNTCRSPMAMALGRKVLARRLGIAVSRLGDEGYDVVSAGTFAMPGMRATPAAEDAMASMDADLASHRSQPVTPELLNRADLVITMGRGHTQAVTGISPSAARKIVPLDPDGDIEDPIGADAEHYKALARRIESLVETRIGELLEDRGDPGYLP